MYKKILVPLDGSKLAEVILPHVFSLASLFEAEILFLQVFQLTHGAYFRHQKEQAYEALPGLDQKELQQVIDEAVTYLDGQVENSRQKGIPARARTAYGPVPSAIINTAVEEKVDLIAMASHGASGIQGVYYGSVAAGVLQRVDRPLLIVRSRES